jgi:hypothetical protein
VTAEHVIASPQSRTETVYLSTIGGHDLWRSFLHFQPELDQAADGFGAAGLIILSGGPSVDRSPHLL